MRYNALVIGCGNIGAGYDLNTKDVLTHAKAFSLRKNIIFSVADIDEKSAKKVAKKYKIGYRTQLSAEELGTFDLVSICTATQSHYDYLAQLSKLPDMPFIICEKPVIGSLKQFASLKKLQLDPNKILVNYIRRFQPGYRLLQKRLQQILMTDRISHVIVRYQRGILNNGSHALDLLNFLTNETTTIISDVKIASKTYDAFSYDPTLSGNLLLNSSIPVSLIGFTNVSFSIFELEIYTGSWKISIEESGNTIRYFKNRKGELIEDKRLLQSNVLKDYMIPVVDYAIDCLGNKKETNFESALSLNNIILKNLA